ncbi:hypothetical protein [Arthrobacter sp. ISL-95]|uniref:hypothetical protein n=1 Tax=Arthrobacter sp. ISL-95 TaxID=2819116 RepID=UPI001BE86288|nr:hypothetical protein [Arthrobacter sp. ISL-95]MBT2585378.1 hypothetical protein [Arthrobacter sp. ISL-95]
MFGIAASFIMGLMLGFHVVDARDNALMHWIFFKVAKSDPRLFQQSMQAEAKLIRELLSSRGIRYEDLKSSLVPTDDGIQAVFLYDWWGDESWNYAVAFANKYLPVLRKNLRTSMLHGDLHDMRGTMPVEALEAALVSHRPRTINWQTQYAVYFNNLKKSDVASLHEELSHEPRYVGYIDVTFAGAVRNFLAHTLASQWVICGSKIILSHGADDPFVGQDDPVGFALPKYGYEVVSLMDSYFTGFFSYKIEATSAPQAGDDRILNLAAVTGELIDLRASQVFVHPDKLDKYLLREENKLRLMTSIGLRDVTPNELASLVKNRLLQSYIYDLRFAVDGTPLFAVTAEFEKPTGGLTRRLLALKYDRATQLVSLVTMY